MTKVTVDVSVVTVLPPASCIATTGCAAQTVVAEPPPGCVVNASCVAAPTVMLKPLLVAAVKEPSVARKMYPVPALSMLQPAKVATPATADLGFTVQVSAPPPGFVLMVNVTLDVNSYCFNDLWPLNTR